jgi:hypothetical protein
MKDGAPFRFFRAKADERAVGVFGRGFLPAHSFARSIPAIDRAWFSISRWLAKGRVGLPCFGGLGAKPPIQNGCAVGTPFVFFCAARIFFENGWVSKVIHSRLCAAKVIEGLKTVIGWLFVV